MGAATSINTSVVGMVLVDGTLAHWGHEHGEVGLVDELVNFLDDAMSDSTGINKNDGMLGSGKVFEDLGDDEVFGFGVIFGFRHVNGGREAGTFDLGLDHIGGEHDVDGLGTEPAGLQGVIDLVCDLGGVVELGHLA